MMASLLHGECGDALLLVDGPTTTRNISTTREQIRRTPDTRPCLRFTGDAKFDPAAHFGSALDGRWAEIPQLNDAARAEQFAPGSLVRFRCMIQVCTPWLDLSPLSRLRLVLQPRRSSPPRAGAQHSV
jgi:hypothetical protein